MNTQLIAANIAQVGPCNLLVTETGGEFVNVEFAEPISLRGPVHLTRLEESVEAALNRRLSTFKFDKLSCAGFVGF